MENAIEALIISFAIIVFIIAISLTMSLFTKTTNTTKEMVYNIDKTNYYKNIEIKSDRIDDLTTREVTVDNVIASLYRYYKENFMVKIYTKSGELHQVFDADLEGEIRIAFAATRKTDRQKALLASYRDGKQKMFGAPWMANTNNQSKYRVDLYVSGKKGYINGFEVDYSETSQNKGLKSLGNVFTEKFVEYMFSGDTIETEDGIETITGNSKEKDKIIIEYREKP